MDDYLMLLFFIIVLIFIISTMILLYDWIKHILKTKEKYNTYGWANYEIFKKEYRKHKWTVEGSKKRYIDDRMLIGENIRTIIYCDADIICFSNAGMIISNPFSYLMVIKFIRDQRRVLTEEWNVKMHGKHIQQDKKKIKWN